jgi:hypothetical protein
VGVYDFTTEHGTVCAPETVSMARVAISGVDSIEKTVVVSGMENAADLIGHALEKDLLCVDE